MNNNFFRQVFGQGGGSSPDRARGRRGTDGINDQRRQGSSSSTAAATASSDSVNRNNMRMSSPQDMFASFVGVAQDYAGVAAAAGAAAAAMAGVEAAAVEAAIAASLREHEQRHGGGGGPFHHSTTRAPPASDSSVRNLPVIEVRKEDLVDPANRECCICLEDHVLHGKAVRLPCAHLFHRPCIIDWLANHSCTCPVCRYELPTDDVEFERHRQERMRHRKPRFARHELERLSNRELKQLLLLQPTSRRNQHQQSRRERHFLDRGELIDHLIESGAVDLVAAPPPVEYRLSVLKAMKASELRRVMNQEAGVYFDPMDVVEKQDMINIFLSSGRLTVIPEEDEVQADQDSEATFAADMEVDEEIFIAEAMEVENEEPNETVEREEEDRKPAAVPRRGPVVETVLPDEGDWTPTFDQRQQQDLREDTTLVMEENESFVEPVVVVKNNEPKVAAYSSDSAAYDHGGEQSAPPLSQTSQTEEQDSGQEEDTKVSAAEPPPPDTVSDVESQSTTMEPEQHRARCCRKRPLNENNNLDSNTSNTESSDGCAPPSSYSYSASSLLRCSSNNNEDGDDAESQSSSAAAADAHCMQTSFQNLSISELRRLGQLHSVDLAGCIEKHEMVKKLSSSVSNHSNEAAAATESTSNNNNSNNHSDENHTIPDALFNEWGVSEILLAASLLDIDLSSSPSKAPSSSSLFNHHNNGSRDGSMENGSSTSRDRSQLIQSLLQACRDRPHVGSYLEALAPLMRLTVPQLRARARAERVTVSDCLEKGDLLRRLLQHSIASTTTATHHQ